MNARQRELIRNGVAPELLHWASCPQGKGGSAPPAPDMTAQALLQSQMSQEIANQQNYANRPNQYTPFGATTWKPSKMIDPATGKQVTQWSQVTRLPPNMQRAVDAQIAQGLGRTQLGSAMMGRVGKAFEKPFDWRSLPNAARTPQAQMLDPRELQNRVQQYQLDTMAPQQTTGTANAPQFGEERRRIEDALFNRMRPEQAQQEERTRTMLANQGLTPGTDAYNTELQRLHEQQAGERFNALQTGGQEQQRLQEMLLGQQQQAFGQDVAAQQAMNQALGQQFGMGQEAAQFYNQAQQQRFGQEAQAAAQNFQQKMAMAEYQNRLRQQGITEQQLARNMPLNEMIAVMQGQQVGMPQMPQFMSAAAGQTPDLLGASQSAYQANLNAYNAGQQQDQSFMSGIMQLGATVAPLLMASDIRLKSNIVRVGTHSRGVGIYEYDIDGRRERGVMAQELLGVAPELVHVRGDGYLMVDYGGL